MTQLTILGTNIRQDADGRYSLGDCWQLSGKAKSNQPSEWYTSTKTQEFLRTLAGEAENSLTQTGDRGSPVTPVEVIKYGPNEGRGFWGNKEAVIHYAMWINPEFCLTVIRAFDAMVSGKGVITVQTLSREQQLASAVLLSQDIIREKDEKIAALTPKAESFDALANLEGRHNLRSAAAQCGWPQNKFIDKLISLGWVYVNPVTGRKHAYSDRIKTGMMEVKNVEVKRTGYTEGVGQPMITQKGLARLKMLLGVYQAAPSREMELH
ncbi:phage antirepressor KilAC domain-containing protein [Gluconobacter cerinus]|uniref:Prophage antirepressor n=1 Tax=Gluconobacter cerinus TaxID=38307 RepID=A0A1B6VLA8_9PROT|nr:phage antirepressor KilAC domain-containing protein [Gluconobacter cerinus]OAJ67747.1 prophage antirepressor [Gluconobacter cerinus]